MRSSSRRIPAAAMVAVVVASFVGVQQDATGQDKRRFDIGQIVSQSDLSNWDIDIAPDGSGLPPGQGTVAEGRSIYESRCIACHGTEGQGQPMDRLAGGRGTLGSANPVKTVGSYWPYATTIFDYVRRAMPPDSPQSLTPDEVYALTAYLLHINGLVGAGATMNAQALPKVQMPARAAFRSDPRPDVSNTACRRDCR